MFIKYDLLDIGYKRRMVLMQEALTEKQRKLVTDNDNLIYKFAHQRHIVVDEYYGILAIGLCNAAKKYNEDKGKFSTFAYRCMTNELYAYWREIYKKSAVPSGEILSYDELENDECFCSSQDSVEDLATSRVALKEFVGTLSNQEKEVTKYLTVGMKQTEIADKMGCTKQNISYLAKKICNKMKHCFGYN